jgi:hypothetical protein
MADVLGASHTLVRSIDRTYAPPSAVRA